MAKENTYPMNWIRPEGLERLEALGFVGSHWNQHACPDWSHKDINCVVWVDFPIAHSDVTSDASEWFQYVVEHNDSQDQLLNTNDITDVISYIDERFIKGAK